MPATPLAPLPTTSPSTALAMPKIPDAPMAPQATDATAKTGTKPAATTTAETDTPAATVIADKPPVDPEAAQADTGSSKVGEPGSLPPQGLPNLPLPTAIATAPADSIIPPPVPSGIPDAATALPEISVERVKPRVQTWQTRLAPSIIPVETNFNYKRVVLPESIYATQYDRENSHLPKRVTREDYEAMLFSVVAKNNIDATRALLNAGTGLEVTNSAGETPLAVAKRSGATDVAQLLIARGAK